MNTTTLRNVLFALAVAGLAACGSKAKKQETVPAATGDGKVATEQPAETTTPTGTASSANLQEVIYFAFDQSDLDADAKKKLEENATWLKADAARTLTIEGHTDEVGTPEYNLGLGNRRAQASREYLIGLGADPKKISVITFGEEKPAGSEDSQNRRSVFIATKK